ncbi:MAG TPA: NADPH-dependent F420 reductase [Candidatus Acidoferrum sp.]|nr:NADPH-dependent F420 reductase [Candidatus Acidoferrum sp.]
MKIGIIGSGNVGGTLGTRWAQAGHQVTFASRKPESKEMRELLANAGPNARAGTVADATQEQLLLVATPWPNTEEALRSAGDLSGKILIDATNPLLNLDALDLGTTTSGGEKVAQWARGARVVKAFNTVGNNIMADPAFDGRRPVLFYCGDDKAAKQTVAPLIAELGFDPIDAGPLSQARTLEPFALLWISLAFKEGLGREFAFQLLRR